MAEEKRRLNKKKGEKLNQDTSKYQGMVVDDFNLNLLATWGGMYEMLNGIAMELSDKNWMMEKQGIHEGWFTESELEERKQSLEDDEKEPPANSEGAIE